jgi:predicted nucleotide-binding protein
MGENYHDLAQCLARAIGQLLDSRAGRSNWGDVRSTALSIWAFSEVVSSPYAQPGSLPEVRQAIGDATAWLIGQAGRDDGGYSWESEAWDTSLAILALVSAGGSTERIDQAVAWLQRIRDQSSGVWYDEVWETTLATVALLRAERSRDKPVRDFSPWLQAVLRWFLQIPSKDSGEFVCPHYSGFLAWILAEVNETRQVAAIRHTDDFERFRKKTMSAVTVLLETIANARAWSSDTFSNAYICLGLLRLKRFEEIDVGYRTAVIDWLRNHQGSSGGFEDTEDTALAIIALAGLLDMHEEGRRAYQEMTDVVPRPKCSTPTCFLGYCSSSKTLALEIKESLKKRRPSVEIRDWAWDFQSGKLLMSEIEKASRECKVSVFLVTKDDQIVKSDRTIESPRDNIIFEVGYFAAKLGLERTLLVVEEGTKLPSDWGGIIYISFRDRNDLKGVNLDLLDRIDTALKL